MKLTNPKISYILYIVYSEGGAERVVSMNYKVLDKKYNLKEKKISESLFRWILHSLTKEGYLERLAPGYYKLTEKGLFAVVNAVLTKGGSSPPPSNSTHKLLLPSQNIKDFYYGIRLHNVKIQVKVSQLPNPLTVDISNIKEATFSFQLFYKNDEPYLLIHIKDDIIGISPGEVLSKLINIIHKIFSILYTKYNIKIDPTEVWIKHQEWAYRFKYSKEFESVLEQLANYVTQIENFKLYIDKSQGYWEIETNDELWATFFYLNQFLIPLSYRNLVIAVNEILKAKPEELHQKIEELRALLFLIPIVKEFAEQIKTHLEVLNGIKNSFIEFNESLKKFNTLLEDFNHKRKSNLFNKIVNMFKNMFKR
jgi:hypothetical protein